ncbi:MAG TPA: ROK family protein [Candidatus Limnocylindrales bacterium]
MLDSDASARRSGGASLTQRPVLGLDLGGTQIRAAVVLADGSTLGRVAAETPVADGRDAIVGRCIDALCAARDAAPVGLAERVEAVGISAPGPLDPVVGVIVDPPNLGAAFHDVPIAARVADALGVPAFLDRDTVLAALAEWQFGAARECTDFLYVTVSTGIGGAVVSDGRLLRGPDGTAGEVGHVTVDASGPKCGCGGVGHLEAVASGRALARDAASAASSGRSPALAARAATLPDGPAGLSARDVADAEAAGDATAHELMEHLRLTFARATVSWVDLFNPERLVVGGSIAEAEGERLLGAAARAIEREAFRAPARRARVVPATLGADVSLVGALPLVASRLHEAATESVHPALVGESVATRP